MLLLTAVIILSGALWVSNQNIDKLASPLPAPTVIYDLHGKPASKLAASPIIPVKLTAISKHMQQAIVAVEDRRFYDHTGVDAGALGRAMFRNASAGGVVEGGSTITQQLAKNVFLSAEKSYKRKLKEAAIAIKIENMYTKDQILELYLNQIYFGGGSWGVEKASRTYFGKNASELTLPEAALLAALPKAPTHYSPVTHKEAAVERRNLVLGLMKEQGYVTEAECKQAQATPLKLNNVQGDALSGKYPSYADYVLEEATARFGLSEKELLTGGYKIYTGLDPKVQQAMEGVYADKAFFPESPDKTLVQSGAVVTDPATGEIKGMVGSRGARSFRDLNRASQIKRQPGSAFKPLAVYAPALEKGYDAESVLYDGKLDIDGYQPNNSDGRYHGNVSLREALIRSYNIPAVWLLNEMGAGTGFDYVRRTGIELTDGDRNLSLALGGLSEGVSPLQMAQAYGALANGGKMNEAHAITQIADQEGHVIAKAELREKQVYKQETAFRMTRLLEEVVKEGTGKRAALSRPTAGKTGTTQLPGTNEFAGLDGSKDVWFVGYTPELAAAVWMGYDQTDSTHYMTASGGTYPAVLFREMMTRALDGVAVKDFNIPDSYDITQAPAFVPVPKRTDGNKQESGSRNKDDGNNNSDEGNGSKEDRQKDRQKDREDKSDNKREKWNDKRGGKERDKGKGNGRWNNNDD
jgi:penicillin-binding protein 2A